MCLQHELASANNSYVEALRAGKETQIKVSLEKDSDKRRSAQEAKDLSARLAASEATVKTYVCTVIVACPLSL